MCGVVTAIKVDCMHPAYAVWVHGGGSMHVCTCAGVHCNCVSLQYICICNAYEYYTNNTLSI